MGNICVPITDNNDGGTTIGYVYKEMPGCWAGEEYCQTSDYTRIYSRSPGGGVYREENRFILSHDVPIPGCSLSGSNSGCNQLQTESQCTSSKDGRSSLITAGGYKVYNEPCVWCGGQPCTSYNNNKCEPKDWLLNQHGKVNTNLYRVASCTTGTVTAGMIPIGYCRLDDDVDAMDQELYQWTRLRYDYEDPDGDGYYTTIHTNEYHNCIGFDLFDDVNVLPGIWYCNPDQNTHEQLVENGCFNQLPGNCPEPGVVGSRGWTTTVNPVQCYILPTDVATNICSSYENGSINPIYFLSFGGYLSITSMEIFWSLFVILLIIANVLTFIRMIKRKNRSKQVKVEVFDEE